MLLTGAEINWECLLREGVDFRILLVDPFNERFELRHLRRFRCRRRGCLRANRCQQAQLTKRRRSAHGQQFHRGRFWHHPVSLASAPCPACLCRISS